ncbi:hypothetical protein ACIRBX_01820 [Kitasatospora sp. NPDC096147]|uniref:hypothetical protein n=1 Tax=Kitasatospora sp. NPDC096147 TaxID=3364093 RepID=UPI00380DEE50
MKVRGCLTGVAVVLGMLVVVIVAILWTGQRQEDRDRQAARRSAETVAREFAAEVVRRASPRSITAQEVREIQAGIREKYRLKTQVSSTNRWQQGDQEALTFTAMAHVEGHPDPIGESYEQLCYRLVLPGTAGDPVEALTASGCGELTGWTKVPW